MRKLALTALLTLAACKEDPGEAHHRAAVDLYKAGDWAKAAAEYEETIKLQPDIDVRVIKKAATAWVKAGEYDKAADLLDRTNQSNTGADKLAGIREIAALYLQSAHDLDKAETWFRKSLEMDPKDEQSLSWLAEISSIRGGARNTAVDAKPDQLDEALKRYDAVLAVNPNSMQAQVNKRIVYLKYLEYLQKKKAGALADMETNKKDKDTAADFKQKADEAQAKWDEMKAAVDEVGKKIGELNRAAKDAQAAKEPAKDAGEPAPAADAGTPPAK